jgi:hypothetical protein
MAGGSAGDGDGGGGGRYERDSWLGFQAGSVLFVLRSEMTKEIINENHTIYIYYKNQKQYYIYTKIMKEPYYIYIYYTSWSRIYYTPSHLSCLVETYYKRYSTRI